MTSKRNKVIFVSILNFIGFVMQSIFMSIAANNSKNVFYIILISIISFIWVSLFTIKALRHSEKALYPAVALTAFAWPSYILTLFIVIIILSFFGIKFP